MFSKFNQLRQNLTDELSKNNDESSASRVNNMRNIEEGEIDMNSGTPEPENDSKSEILTTLPPEIKGKLKKFAKYEAKYPLLLEAYKNEKAKNELVAKFETILRENTPCSSITEGDALAEYLNSLTLKNTMLNEELRKITKDHSEKDNFKVKELEQKVSELQTLLKKNEEQPTGTESEKRTKVLSEDENDKKKDLEKAEAQIKELEGEVEKLKKDNKTLETTLSDNSNAETSSITETNELKSKVKQLEKKIEGFEKSISTKDEDLKILQNEKNKLSDELHDLQSQYDCLQKDHCELQTTHTNLGTQLDNLKKDKENLEVNLKENDTKAEKTQKTIGGLEDKLKLIQGEFDEKLSEIGELKIQLESVSKNTDETQSTDTKVSETEVQAPQPSSSNKKNKKKNKKKSKANNSQQAETSVKDTEQLEEEPSENSTATDGGLSELQAKYDSLVKEFEELKSKQESSNVNSIAAADLQTQLEKLKQDYKTLQKENEKNRSNLKVKDEEIENIRDMLREVGDDLVTSRDEVKDVKQKYEELLKSQKSSEDLSKTNESDLAEKISIIEAQKVELEVLRGQHSQAVTDYEKEKAENRKLVTVTQEEKKNLEEKVSELEKKIKELENEHDLKMKSATKELASLKKENDQHAKTIKLLTDEKTDFTSKISKFQEQLKDLSKLQRSESSLKKELDATQTNLVHKEKTIVYFEKQVKEYELNKSQLINEFNKLKAANKDLGSKISLLNEQRSKLNHEKLKLNETLHDMKIKMDESIEENKRLTDKVDVLQDKYSGLQELKSTSNDQVESIKKQCEELSINSKEARQRVEQLEEELSESRAMLQERTREASTIRRLLMESEENQSTKIKELNSKVITLSDERDRLQSENSIELTRKQRELEEVQFKNQELEKIINGWEQKEESLVKEIKELKNSTSRLELERRSSNSSSDELTSVMTKLKDSLSVSERKMREYENLNNVLKKLNEELTMKLDRMTKNYKLISSQLNSIKEKTSSSTAASTPSPSPLTTRSNSIVSNLNEQSSPSPSISNNGTNGLNEEKIAYVKNVLLGFLEHKDQRQQLLPVISMLLQLSKTDEKRLLVALK